MSPFPQQNLRRSSVPNIKKEECEKSVPKSKVKKLIYYDNNGRRELIIPRTNPVEQPAIWSNKEFTRLKEKAHIVTLQDRIAMIEESAKQKRQLKIESQKRKDLLLSSQVVQRPAVGSTLLNVENEADAKTQYLLQRSKELIQEQDDRVKQANGLILATKCHAIRTAQIAERELIIKQLEEEDRRLDLMMEQRRQAELRREEEMRNQLSEKNEKYKAELNTQITRNEIGRLIEAEKKEEESRRINQASIELQREELELLRKRRIQQQKVREEFNKANSELESYKQIQKEEDRIADLRAQRFMEQKMEREKQLEEERKLVRDSKEREIARLQQAAQSSLDKAATVDEMNAKRIQEEVEKAWRQKELKAARKKQEDLENLRKGREQQLEDLRRVAAIGIASEEYDFQKIAKIQKQSFEKDQEKKREKLQRNILHRKELLKQIDFKERERMAEMKEKFEEGAVQRLEDQLKNTAIEKYLKKKVDNLRQQKVPENYIHDIEVALKIK